jgi:hypothetical protein
VVSSENNNNNNSNCNTTQSNSKVQELNKRQQKHRTTTSITTLRPCKSENSNSNNNNNESNETFLSHLKTEFKLHRRNNTAVPPSSPHQTAATASNQFCLFPKATAFSLLNAPDLLSESLSSEDQDLTLHGNTSESIDTTETLELAQHTQDEAEDEEDNDDIFELKRNCLNQAEEEEEEEGLEDDVIPFDACEYEKIEIITPDVCYKRQHTEPHTLLNEYYSSTSALFFRAVKSKSLSRLNDCHVLSYFRLSNKYLTRTMSHVNLNLVEEETQTNQQNHYIHHLHHNHQQQQAIVSLIKTSKTESEIFSLSANLNETSLPNEATQGQMSHEEYAESEDLIVKQKKHNRKHRSRYNYSRIGINY